MTEPEPEPDACAALAAKRRRQRALTEWLDELDHRHGAVPEALVAHYEELLSLGTRTTSVVEE